VAAEAGRMGSATTHHDGPTHGAAATSRHGYFEDDGNLITMAMNGWDAAEPAWWLNLQDHPDAIAETRDGTRQVHARRAQGHERERLWSRWAEIDKNLDAYAARRPRETAVVVLEPRGAASPST
jgi:F420H(2)-dependent quinone reductase